MEENISINLCRICLDSGANISIFAKNEDENCDIQSNLSLCLKEKIEDIEGYPRFICQACNDILNTACSFINKYRDTCKILENGLDILKHENEELSSVSCKEQSEEEIEIETIKNEYKSDDDDDLSDHCQDFFKPLQLKLNLKLEKEKVPKVIKRKRVVAKTNSKQITNKIASSILEGEFAWNGDECFLFSLNSSKNKQSLDKSKRIKQKPEIRKRIKIKLPKTKKPNPPKLCDLCGEVFKNQDKLSIHKKNVHFRNPVKCIHCLRLFVSDYYLNRHVKRKHETDKKFICAICGRGFAFKGELSSHNKNVHNKHLKPKKQYKCKFCNKLYKCAKSVVVHERSAHTGQRPAVCSVCGSSFFHDDYLKEHMRLHTGETPFKCPICDRGYAQRCNMKSHLRIHKKSELDAATLSKLRPNYLRLLKA
ncbi:zinc finger protein 62-like isoform X2 [Vanessa cardui]|uniref:zinc finger protein 62-like isoform X2 n=1 Tax=Vanessa cardui TaxID=171605 RepID=UPI001F13104D|nr:zinc finger protein 62-like isoform X2 [Vanessa cardui]